MSYLETIGPDHDFKANSHVNWMLNHELAGLIMSEKTGVLPSLYNFFDMEKKPLTPLEFYFFWTHLTPEEQQYFADAAFDMMPPGVVVE